MCGTHPSGCDGPNKKSPQTVCWLVGPQIHEYHSVLFSSPPYAPYDLQSVPSTLEVNKGSAQTLIWMTSLDKSLCTYPLKFVTYTYKSTPKVYTLPLKVCAPPAYAITARVRMAANKTQFLCEGRCMCTRWLPFEPRSRAPS